MLLPDAPGSANSPTTAQPRAVAYARMACACLFGDREVGLLLGGDTGVDRAVHPRRVNGVSDRAGTVARSGGVLIAASWPGPSRRGCSRLERRGAKQKSLPRCVKLGGVYYGLSGTHSRFGDSASVQRAASALYSLAAAFLIQDRPSSNPARARVAQPRRQRGRPRHRSRGRPQRQSAGSGCTSHP